MKKTLTPKKSTAVLYIAVFGFVLFLCGTSFGQTEQLTDNLRSEREPRISDKHAVWAAFDGKDPEIFLYEISSKSLRQLTENDRYDQAPAVSAAHVVWASTANGTTEIVLYTLATGARKTIATFNALDAKPYLSDKYVVWVNFSAGKGAVTLYDIQKGTTKVVASGGVENRHARVSNTHVVYHSVVDAVASVYVYTIAGGQTRKLSQQIQGWNPEVSERYVVWQSENNRIVVYDLTTNKFVTDALVGAAPQIVGENIIWQGGVKTSQDIFIYSLKEKTARCLISTGMSYYDLHFCATRVVWRFFDGSDYEIYLHTIEAPKNDAPLNKISVYPNPAVNSLNIIYGETGNKPNRLAFIDANNVIVKKYDNPRPEEDANIISLDVTFLPPGVYSLQITIKDAVENVKVIKR